MKPICVFASDAAFAMPLATALRSIVETNRRFWPMEFYILAGGMPEETREKISRSLPNESASINWITVDPSQFSRFVEHGRGACAYGMAYARLLIPYLLPESTERVLYLDPDILVMDDLMPLWETDLDGAVVGAVADACLPGALERGAVRPEQVPQVEDYFNSGVLLINLPLWRERKISEKAMQYLEANPLPLYADQDALNAVCDRLWRKLEPRWNYQEHLRTRIAKIEPSKRPGIVHFVTRVKPWDVGMPSLNAKFYDSYRSRTCFARTLRQRLADGIARFWTNTKVTLKKRPMLRDVLRMIKAPQGVPAAAVPGNHSAVPKKVLTSRE